MPVEHSQSDTAGPELDHDDVTRSSDQYNRFGYSSETETTNESTSIVKQWAAITSVTELH